MPQAVESSAVPKTVDEAIGLLVANTAAGRPRRSWEVMTPSRYVHATELLQAGAAVEVVVGAISRINASHWLRKPVAEVTDEDERRALEMSGGDGTP